MGRTLLRVLGVVIGGYALLLAASAAVFRMDTAGELEWILRVDLFVGLAFAIAVVLVRVPAAGAGTARSYWVTAFVAVLVLTVVSSTLMWSHFEQHRIRTSPVASE